MTTLRIHLSAYPLGCSEPAKVQSAIRGTFNGISWIRNRDIGGAWLTEISLETQYADEYASLALEESVSIAIWKAIGRYVKVAVDISDDARDIAMQRELAVADYRKLMGIF
ncbi:hypothetical protein KSF73_00110 [Burkholderiaceae bacterium DAT-1]|nr:hypothetical protein [Burkholderiaceae bacterium DAT-1]